MQYNHDSWGGEQASPLTPKPFTLIQHNCLGSWDVFLSLFESFTQLTYPPSIISLQDPRSADASSPRLDCTLLFPPPRPADASPGLPFIFLVLFCQLFPSYLVSSAGEMSWLLTSSPTMASLILP